MRAPLALAACSGALNGYKKTVLTIMHTDPQAPTRDCTAPAQVPGAEADPALRPTPFPAGFIQVTMAQRPGILYFLFDRDHGPTDRLLSRWLFLRCLGLIYFSAFFALLFQVLGLNGSHGILPAANFLESLRALGQQRFWLAPSLLWWSSSDHALMALVWAGLIASVMATFNLLPRFALLVCFVCFLSFVAVARDFGLYQSDGMLLEAGFLSLLIAPKGLRPGWGRASLAPRAALFLLLWEWFRIYFESGVVKLASGDPTWRNLTAMYEYYQNGPLPTWIGWYLQHLPFGFHKFSAAATLVMELVLVFLAFLPRPWRIACFVVVTVWQAIVISTANYAFLNYLVLVLGFLLLDDRALIRFVPHRFRAGLTPVSPSTLTQEPLEDTLTTNNPTDAPSPAPRRARRHPREVVRALRIALTTVSLSFVAYATTIPLILMLIPGIPFPTGPMTLLEPFRVANTYGLFANMTPHRYEIEFQGSDANQTWTPYLFRYKPQDLRERPRIYAPYQPRFDWNLWFASLTDWQQAPIVPRTEIRLLEGSPQVLALFAGNPFPNHPPRFVRAVLYQYWFSTPLQKRSEGLWWTRKLLGTYAPTITRQPDGKYAAVAVPELNGPPA